MLSSLYKLYPPIDFKAAQISRCVKNAISKITKDRTNPDYVDEDIIDRLVQKTTTSIVAMTAHIAKQLRYKANAPKWVKDLVEARVTTTDLGDGPAEGEGVGKDLDHDDDDEDDVDNEVEAADKEATVEL